MITFNELYDLAILNENTVQLTQPTNQNAVEPYNNIKKFVEGYTPTPLSEILSKITEDQLKNSKVKKEDLNKILNFTNKQIPLLNGITVNDLFSPNNFVANLYNVINNAEKNPKIYEKVVESYKQYSSNPSSDSLANLIVTVNLSNQGSKAGVFANTIITKLINIIPGTSAVNGMLMGTIAAAAPQLLLLKDDFDTLGSGIGIVQTSGISPGQIIGVVGEESVKNFTFGSIVGAGALAKGTELAAQAGETASEIGAKAKEKLTNFLNSVKSSSGGGGLGLFSPSKGRIPAYSPGTNLRGAIGATTPAKY